jgi:hypothetical protein
MNNFTIFVVGLIVTLITGMGVITSEVFLGYKKSVLSNLENEHTVVKPTNNLENRYSIN